MAETFTTRLNLRKWGDGAVDGPARTEFNIMWDDLEARLAMYGQGTLAARPAAAAAQEGKYYTVVGDATTANNGRVYYCTGSTWVLVGANLVDVTVRASASGAVPLTVKAATGQTANIFEARDETDTTKISIDASGALFGVTARIQFLMARPITNGVAFSAVGSVGQTANLTEWMNSSFTTLAKINAAGIAEFDKLGTNLAATPGSAFGGVGKNSRRLIVRAAGNAIVPLEVAGETGHAQPLQTWSVNNVSVASMDQYGNLELNHVEQLGIGKKVYSEKTIDEVLPAFTTTLQVDNELGSFDLDHDFGTWLMRIRINYVLSSATNGGLKFSPSLPSGAIWITESGGPGTPMASISSGGSGLTGLPTNTPNTSGTIDLVGRIKTGAVSGQFSLLWAQLTSVNNTTTIKALSYVQMERLV